MAGIEAARGRHLLRDILHRVCPRLVRVLGHAVGHGDQVWMLDVALEGRVWRVLSL